MNTRIPILALLLTSLCGAGTTSLQAGPRATEAFAYPIDQIVGKSEGIVKLGSADSTVRYLLGSPSRTIGDDVWVFHNYKASSDEARAKGCTMLVVTFDNSRVTDIKLVNPKGVRVLVAAADRGPEARNRTFVAQK
jgi:hypothetical protein